MDKLLSNLRRTSRGAKKLKEVKHHRIYHRYTRRHEPARESYLGSNLLFQAKTILMLLVSFVHLLLGLRLLMTFGLCVLGTLLCYHYQLFIELPVSVLASGIFFPISFGISFTFTRRETLLQTMADLKSSCVYLYLCCRDFQNPGSDIADKMKSLCARLLHSIGLYSMHHGSSLREIYFLFEEMTQLLIQLRAESDWVRSVVSRAYQYRRFIINDFERIRITHDYRTPSTLRAYGLFLTSLGPLLFSPYFAKLSHDFGLWAGLYTGGVVVAMTMTLFYIYEENEDPCDGFGRDNLDMDILNQVVEFMVPPSEEPMPQQSHQPSSQQQQQQPSQSRKERKKRNGDSRGKKRRSPNVIPLDENSVIIQMPNQVPNVNEDSQAEAWDAIQEEDER
eukprot:TRINITY_DN4629_c0_g2_i1.p1 TRINITY_DN4629_c0_g2~~TRINITY_DN4629_c0_g2_i1.p1  ORF type:complete len:392 (-),score=70.02 TRINITY_DN4629_c0_g2_i1:38-1213(-)